LSFTVLEPGVFDGKVNSGSVAVDGWGPSDNFGAIDVAGGEDIGNTLAPIDRDMDSKLDLRLQ
jgi:hypothetical protein